jgi:hypothetical protein
MLYCRQQSSVLISNLLLQRIKIGITNEVSHPDELDQVCFCAFVLFLFQFLVFVSIFMTDILSSGQRSPDFRLTIKFESSKF